jgi:hypothetical protein
MSVAVAMNNGNALHQQQALSTVKFVIFERLEAGIRNFPSQKMQI